jgi:phosphoglycerate dehydrogenase-like enzyme
VILAIGPTDDLVRHRLADFGPYVEVAADYLEAIAEHLPSAVAIAARATAVVDAAAVEAAPKLRVIGRSGVGVDRVDVRAATARGIPVVITPNAGTRAVAEGTLALILHLVKRLGPLTDLVRDSAWDRREQLPLGDLDGATLGIVGYGRIGRRVAELAAVFGMTIIAHDPYADAATVYDPEPPDRHPVFGHPDVVLTPHVMALSRRARQLVFAEMADGIAEVLAGRMAPHVANPEVYEHQGVKTP